MDLSALVPLGVLLVAGVSSLLIALMCKPASLFWTEVDRRTHRREVRCPRPEPTHEEIRRERYARHRAALRDWDVQFIRAVPRAELEAMDAEYRREHPEQIVEIDLSTPEGMKVAEMLDERERYLSAHRRQRQERA